MSSHAIVAAVSAALLVLSCPAQELVFLPASDAAAQLRQPDDFTQRLSPFDRAARMQTNGPVDDATFRDFVAAAALDWTEAERQRITTAYDSLRPELIRLKVPVPERLRLIRTSGREEGEAAYTRADAIVLPSSKLRGAEAALPRLLAHELFHVISRANPELRDRLYRIIGFEPCGEVKHPTQLQDRRITNPDAPINAHAIEVTVDRAKVWAVPILYSNTAVYDPARSKTFFDHLTFEFLLVELRPNRRHQVPGDRLRLVSPEKAEGFQDKIGRNTGYVIHPEEICADNFMLLLTGVTTAKTPGILERMQDELSR
jgi:hypothetical protein